MLAPLPIDPLLPEVVRALGAQRSLVLEAPPGAGKTTRVPRALLDAWSSGEILVLEPRRLAARLAARRVAEELGEEIGATIGYQVRFEDVSSAKTRVRFVTEGVLTRRLLSDPQLRSVRAVLLDEFHERHLHGDVALALLRALQGSGRPDLSLIVMSATLDAAPLAAFLGAPTIRAEGRRFEVAIEHLPSPDDRPLPSLVASAVRALLARGLEGDALVFLPGAAEIRRAREGLEAIAREADLLLVPLHGDLPPEEQDRAIRPAGRRKVILSTNVAESSVTIDGVVAVIDGGLARVASHAAWSGLPSTRIEKISRASAAQRAGRAGRTRPGVCLRLYTRADHDARPEHDVPEIRRMDLAQTRLELTAQHGAGASALPWFEPPPAGAWRAAGDLLVRLGAIDRSDRPTPLGRRMLSFPLHPRLARVVVEAEARGVAEDGVVVASLAAERDLRTRARGARFDGPPGARDVATERSDLVAMVDLFREAGASRFSDGALRAIGLDPAATFAVERARKHLLRTVRRGERAGGAREDEDVALLKSVLAGYPDRVAKRKKPGSRELAIAGGGIAELSESSAVRDSEWMVAVDAERREGTASGRGGTIVRLASGIEPDWLIEVFPDAVIETDSLRWDAARERVERLSQMSYEGLALLESRSVAPFGSEALDAEASRILAGEAATAGARAFAPGAEAAEALERWLSRARFAASVGGPRAPTSDDVREAIVRSCEGRSSFAELRERPLLDVLRSFAGHANVARIDALAPETLRLIPTRTARIHYEDGKGPWVEAFLQDFFGLAETPRIGEGRVAVVAHLLAPNRRAVQVTSDLSSFWEKHYPTLRKELSRRYPRHKWPENPR